jgi:hypothetical protein
LHYITPASTLNFMRKITFAEKTIHGLFW